MAGLINKRTASLLLLVLQTRVFQAPKPQADATSIPQHRKRCHSVVVQRGSKLSKKYELKNLQMLAMNTISNLIYN